MRHLLPATRDAAMAAFAGNFPVGTSRKQGFKQTPISAGAAWRHHTGDATTRFVWENGICGPRATVMHISNGPAYFAREWRRLVVQTVVARSRLFACLPQPLLRTIMDLAA